MYIEDVITNTSDYIYVVDNERGSGPYNLDATIQPISTLGLSQIDTYLWKYDQGISSDSTNITRLSLTGGADGTSPSDAEIINGWEQFRNADNIDVNLLIQAGGGSGLTTAIQNRMIDICEDRADCIAILDVPYSQSTPMSAIDYKKKQWNPNTSYAALYWPWIKIYDRFRDTEIWVPPSTFVGYVYAKTDFTREAWFAPAGLTRGRINALDIQYKASQGERDLLYINNINPIAFFPGEGIAVWGQKTLQVKASSLDRVNVRRLLLVLEKAIAKAAKYILFEPNDRFTRKLFTQTVEPFLRDVQARRGITYYSIVCDESNNTSAVIDRNELIMDIFIQPTKSTEFITLKLNILRTGVLASELVTT